MAMTEQSKHRNPWQRESAVGVSGSMAVAEHTVLSCFLGRFIFSRVSRVTSVTLSGHESARKVTSCEAVIN